MSGTAPGFSRVSTPDLERVLRALDEGRLGPTVNVPALTHLKLHHVMDSMAPYLGLEQSDALVALQRRLKRAFDPEGLLNPGKIFASSGHRSC